DGNYLYYTHNDPANPNNTNVYSVPALGGTSQQIVSDVNTNVSFSPDGKRMAYGRFIQDTGDSQVLVANIDGSGEQLVVRIQSGGSGFNTNPSWSTSIDKIAIGAVNIGGKAICSIKVFTPQGKLVKEFPIDMLINGVAWLPDASGLFFIGAEKSAGLR